MNNMWLINAIKFDPSAIDGQAWTIFITGLTVVFIALWAIAIILRQIQRVLAKSENKIIRPKKNRETTIELPQKPIAEHSVSDEETNVAIALALHFYLDDQHDEESLVLTMNPIERQASPWAAKTFNTIQK